MNVERDELLLENQFKNFSEISEPHWEGADSPGAKADENPSVNIRLSWLTESKTEDFLPNDFPLFILENLHCHPFSIYVSRFEKRSGGISCTPPRTEGSEIDRYSCDS
jgi:hypothetical protein